jgi:hypothetical protein
MKSKAQKNHKNPSFPHFSKFLFLKCTLNQLLQDKSYFMYFFPKF